jgi:hypothetical protein
MKEILSISPRGQTFTRGGQVHPQGHTHVKNWPQVAANNDLPKLCTYARPFIQLCTYVDFFPLKRKKSLLLFQGLSSELKRHRSTRGKIIQNDPKKKASA